MPNAATRFAVLAAVRHAAHHVGDYWVQTDRQAAYKGTEGRTGVLACLAHTATYTATNLAAVTVTNRALHWLVRKLDPISGKAAFVAHGGLPYLDQSWHHAFNAISAGITATITRKA